MDPANTLGSIGGVLIVICQVPQLKKLIMTKSAGDISLETYTLLFLGQVFWFAYGILKNDLQIIITNAISGILTLVTLSASIYFKFGQEWNSGT